jgi:hypothetical protein
VDATAAEVLRPAKLVRIRHCHDFAKQNRKRDANRNKCYSRQKSTEKDGETPQRRVEENAEMCESAQGKQIVAQSRCTQGFRGSAGE